MTYRVVEEDSRGNVRILRRDLDSFQSRRLEPSPPLGWGTGHNVVDAYRFTFEEAERIVGDHPNRRMELVP